jgi:hypothetical protein
MILIELNKKFQAFTICNNNKNNNNNINNVEYSLFIEKIFLLLYNYNN